MAVFIKKVNIPQKSDLINIDMTGSGTAQTYRIIKKISDDVVEVIGMTNISNSQKFASSGQTYENSTLDTYLNTTWYNTLSNDAKLAIVDKTFTQDSWYWSADGNPDYNGYYGREKPGDIAYTISLGSASFGNEITRHVYALSTQDVLDYILDTNITDGLLQNYNIWKMFWNDEVQHTGNTIWLRSAGASNSSYVFIVFGYTGFIDTYLASSSYAVRPSFQIDLSKIDYTFTDGRQPVELKPVSVLQKSNNALSRVGMSYKVPIIYPTKSDIVDIDMTGSGTTQQYRVLKVNGSIAEVLSLSDASASQKFGSNNTYQNSDLDTYLNITWYNTLSNTAKAAIIDKTFRQDSWYYSSATGNPIYQGKFKGNIAYQVSLGSTSYGNEITRHVYALSTQDVIDYLEVTPEMTTIDTTLTYDNLWTMFWNSTTTHNGYPWLRSAVVSDIYYEYNVGSDYGNLNNSRTTTGYAVRPAFQIDLSKIDFTIE